MRRKRTTCYALAPLMTMMIHPQHCAGSAFTPPAKIIPGTGLTLSSETKSDYGNVAEIVIFEHTELGSGGLVLNNPTPLLLRDLNIPRFEAFGSNALMLGCGMETRKNDDEGEGTNNVAIGDMSPWFWLHDVDGIPGSFRLEGADGPLYLGGNIEEAARRIATEGIDPVGHFKFFTKYMGWKSGELDHEVQEGRWLVHPQSPKEALRPYSMARIV